MHLSEQEQIRRNALEELKKLGINPYPPEAFNVNAYAKQIHEEYPKDNTLFQEVSVAEESWEEELWELLRLQS